MTVAVIFGGPAPEHDVSILTGLQAVRELQHNGREVVPIYWDKQCSWFRTPADAEGKAFVDGAPRGSDVLRLVIGSDGGFFESSRIGREKKLEISAALICCHGAPGEDGTLQSALDLAGISYSGPTAAGASLGMDKLAFGAVAASVGIPTLPRDVVREDHEPSFPGPYIVKPRFGGSSIGIEIVEDHATAVALLKSSPHFVRGAVVEPYRSDLIDLNIAVRTYPEVQLSAIERPLRSEDAGILNYKDKYVGGEGFLSAPRELPAVVPPEIQHAIEVGARRLVAVAGVRGLARIDFLWHDENIFVNEINTIPGSLSKYLWISPAISFSQLLSDLIDEAVKFPTHRYSTAGADGAALRAAGNIASKLD